MKKITLITLLLVGATAYGHNHETPAPSHSKKSVRLTTGITMYYTERGNVGGSALVLLHGLTDTGRSFERLVEELVRQYPQLWIIVPDLRGHGDTSMPSRKRCGGAPEACFTPEALAADVVALFDALAIDAAFLVGHSMGSVVAQEVALGYPGRVHNMVLIGTFVYGRGNPVFREYLLGNLVEKSWRPILETEHDFAWPLDAYTITPADLGAAETLRLRKEWVSETGAPEAFLDSICRETAQIRLGTWIGAATASDNVDNRVALQALKVPTLVLWAIQDMAFGGEEQERVKTALQEAARANGTPMIFKTYGKKPHVSNEPQTDLGHNLHWAAPVQVAADIISFVRTGFPKNALAWLNPDNPYEVLEAPGAAVISVWGTDHVRQVVHDSARPSN